MQTYRIDSGVGEEGKWPNQTDKILLFNPSLCKRRLKMTNDSVQTILSGIVAYLMSYFVPT